MNRYTRAVPWGAVLALSVMSALAQNATPPNTATPPATLGTTPQEAAEANQKAVPRSDTGTVVRTSPSTADKARAALNDTGTGTTAGSTTAATPMNSTSGSQPTAGMRSPHADRN